MGSSAEQVYDEVVRTPAFRGAMEELLKAGVWVPREVFDAMGHSPVAMDNALSDLVMLGMAEFQRAAGYRLARSALLRQVGRRLVLSGRDREVLARLVDRELAVGCAARDARGDVALVELRVPVPAGMGPLEQAQWAADAVCGSFRAGVGHG